MQQLALIVADGPVEVSSRNQKEKYRIEFGQKVREGHNHLAGERRDHAKGGQGSKVLGALVHEVELVTRRATVLFWFSCILEKG